MNNELVVNPELFATLIEGQYGDLVTAAEQVGSEHAEWKPLDKGRTVLSQLQECAIRAERMAGLLSGESLGGRPTPEDLARFATFEAAVEGCKEGGAAFAAALRTTTEQDLLKIVETPFGEFSIGRLVVGSYWNASYHEGAITYISTLLEEPTA